MYRQTILLLVSSSIALSALLLGLLVCVAPLCGLLNRLQATGGSCVHWKARNCSFLSDSNIHRLLTRNSQRDPEEMNPAFVGSFMEIRIIAVW